VASETASARNWALAAALALTVHGVAVGALGRMQGSWREPPPPPVEFELREPPPPPPPEVIPEPPPPPPRAVEVPRPRPVVVKRVVVPEPPPPPDAPPPPPNQKPPAETPPEAPPVFGVTMDSTVSGGAGMAVAVGNTLMAKPNAAPRGPAAAQAYSGGPPADAFRPVADAYIATQAKVLHAEDSAEYYPPDALALGLEGAVTLSVGINEKGAVVEVRVLKRAGHKFDEAAASALRKFRFAPARTSDGRAVPTRITYSYKFTVSN